MMSGYTIVYISKNRRSVVEYDRGDVCAPARKICRRLSVICSTDEGGHRELAKLTHRYQKVYAN